MELLNKIKRKVYYPVIDKIITKRLSSKHYYPSSHIEEQDIIIAGFPKSGNTWMQYLISGIIYGMDTHYLPDRLRAELVPATKKGFYSRVLDFTCFKSHDLPKKEYRKVIHLVRDGRDAMASYFHFRNAKGFDESMEDHIIRGKGVHPCKWHEYNQQWIDNPYNAEIMVIRYEDLLDNTFKEMKRFCDFANIKRDDSILLKSIEGNSFSSMKTKEKQFKRDGTNWSKKKSFYRKGKSGSYKEEIPQELIKYFESESESVLKHFGYDV